MITIYERRAGQSRYPMIRSGSDARGLPIPWAALSGFAGDLWDGDTLYAVSDAFLATGFIYTVDVSQQPVQIVDRLAVIGASSSLDLEGIAVGPDGYFWVASEGNASRPNLILKVDPGTGLVVGEIELPAFLAANTRTNGFEGIAVTGAPGAEQVYVAIQRAWPATGDTDELHTRIGRYDVATAAWGFVYYPFEAEGNGDWIGLSELTLLPDGSFAVIERDKGWGPTTGFVAELKALFRVDLAGAAFRAYDDAAGLVTVDKQLIENLAPQLERSSIFTAEKLEGLAVSASGNAYVVTDNDGLDDAPGETVFLHLGPIEHLLGD